MKHHTDLMRSIHVPLDHDPISSFIQQFLHALIQKIERARTMIAKAHSSAEHLERPHPYRQGVGAFQHPPLLNPKHPQGSKAPDFHIVVRE